jgi:hypothetical protein
VRWLEFGLALALVLGVGAAAAKAQEQRIDVEVMVSHVSSAEGEIDPRGRKLNQKLKDQFRYESLRVLQVRRLRLALDEVGSVKLPNGKSMRVQPLQVSGSGVLLAVDVEGAARMDLKVRDGHLVVIGAERYKDGKLVISLEPSW